MNQDINYTYDEIIRSLLEQTSLSDLNFTDTESLTEMQFSGFLEKILEVIRNQIHLPLQMLLLLLGVILLSSVAGSLKQEKSGISQICDVISVLCAVSIVITPITDIFLKSAQILEKSADFMITFSGVFGGILAVSGNLTASAGYQGAVLALCNIALEIAVRILFPVLTMGLAVSVTDAVNPAVSLSGILKLIQKFTVWVLGFLMALFLGFLSVQSVVSVSADRTGTKAVKYAISGFVPFIGGAVSDAYSAVLGSMNVLKSTAGMIGVLAVLAILLPVIIELFLYQTMLSVTACVCEIFALRLSGLFRNLEMILSVGFSVAVSFGVMFIVSTGLLATISSL